MYESFFGLRAKPFQIEPDPDYLYRSSIHAAALAYLEYGISENTGIILLTGEIGSGKTTLVHYLVGRLSSLPVDSAVVFNTNVTPEELLQFILDGFGAPRVEGGKASLWKALTRLLLDRHAQQMRVLLILDEAQNLPDDALEEIRMLSNMRKDGRPLLQIIIVGQPELADRIQNPSLKQFAQRIAARFHLTGLQLEETGDYIAFRMGQAGGRSGLFEAPAVELIHRISGGIPRAINLVCQAALVYGYADGASVIGADIVRQVHADQAGPVAVRARSEPTAAAGQAAPDTNGDGLKQGIEVIGAELRELKRMMTRQFEALQVKRLGSIESAVARLQGLLQEERRRNAELNKQNQELKVLGLRLRDELKRRDAH